MVFGKPKLVSASGKPPAEDGRADLRAAIAEAAEIRKQRTKLDAAVERAARLAKEAEESLAEATAAVVRAREVLQQKVTAAVREGTQVPASDSALETARRRESAARDRAEAAQAAFAAIAGERDAIDIQEVQENVAAAAKAVMRLAGEEILRDAEKLRDEFCKRIVALAYIAQRCRGPEWPETDLQKRLERFVAAPLEDAPGMGHSLSDSAAAPLVAPWQAALDALQQDAEAKLP